MQKTALCAAVVVVLACAAYSNSFRVPFIFDDKTSIQDNPSIRQLWPLWPVLFPRVSSTVVGRPLLNLSLALNYAWGGTDVWGYHASNLGVHILAGMLLFGVVRRTLCLPTMPAYVQRDAGGLALAVALIWTIHPLQTESVTYVVQRAESLQGLFYFGMLYCLIRGATVTRGNWRWYAGALCATALGMATKETMFTGPIMALAYDRVFLSRSLAEMFRKRGGLYLGLAATWGLLAALMLESGGRLGTAGFGRGMRSWDYAMTQFGAIAGYLRLSFWPHPLIFDYGMKVARSPDEIIPPALLIAALLTGTVVALWRWPWFGFLGFWVFLILAPTSSIVPLVTQTIAEHRMYLPLAGIVALAVMLAYLSLRRISGLIARDGPSADKLQRLLCGATLAGVAILFVVMSFQRNHDYRTETALWESQIARGSANGRVYYSLGSLYLRDNDPTRAIAAFDKSLELEPRSFIALFNRGGAHAQLEQYEEAVSDFDQALRLNRDSLHAYCSRGEAHEKLQHYAESYRDYSQAVNLDPRFELAYFARGRLNKAFGEYRLAIADFTKVIELGGQQPVAYFQRGECYRLLRENERALADFNLAIAMAPRFAEPYAARARLYCDLRQFDNARADVRTYEQLGGESDAKLLEQLGSEQSK